MAEISGARIIARSLRQQGVEYVFGVVGFPVFGIASAADTRELSALACLDRLIGTTR